MERPEICSARAGCSAEFGKKRRDAVTRTMRGRSRWNRTLLGACLATPIVLGLLAGTGPTSQAESWISKAGAGKRIGIIGLDTSHAPAFTRIFNAPGASAESLRGFRVVAAYPQGSRDIEISVSRVPEYVREMRDMGVEIVDSIAALVGKVDFVLLTTNDGRVHFEQALPVIAAGKPLYVDKPMAASLADVIALFAAARARKVPVFSASSLRWIPGAQELRDGSQGPVRGADTFSWAALEP